MNPVAASAAQATVAATADQNVGVAATLLKKINTSEKEMVQTLLDSVTQSGGQLDIKA